MHLSLPVSGILKDSARHCWFPIFISESPPAQYSNCFLYNTVPFMLLYCARICSLEQHTILSSDRTSIADMLEVSDCQVFKTDKNK